MFSFRRWADSDQYPERGEFHFLQGEIWVNLHPEPLFTHNLLRTRLTTVISECRDDGYFFMRGIRFSHVAADISVQPDLVFVSYDAIQQNRVKLVRGQLGGYVELEGSPELVVEIVSASSVRKDTEVLREHYALAGVQEYWLINARSPSPTLEILLLTGTAYQPAEKLEQGQLSKVLSRVVALTQETDPLGNPRYQFRITEPAAAS